MRQLPRHSRAVRSLLRVLRPRARAWGAAPDLVAAVACGGARAAGGGAHRRHLVGPGAPDQITCGGGLMERLITGAHSKAHTHDQPWGRLASITLPGGSELSIYEPRHLTPPHD